MGERREAGVGVDKDRGEGVGEFGGGCLVEERDVLDDAIATGVGDLLVLDTEDVPLEAADDL